MSVFTRDGTENRMRWDRHTPGFIEVWYAIVTHAGTGTGFWVRYALMSPKGRTAPAVCELWAFVFHPERGPIFAGVTRYPLDRLAGPDGRDDGAVVRIGDAWLSETHLEGEVVTDRGVVSWSLDLRPADACFQPRAIVGVGALLVVRRRLGFGLRSRRGAHDARTGAGADDSFHLLAS